MNKKLLALIKKYFDEALAAKPTWGKNEIARLYDQAVARAAVEMLDE